MPPPLPPSYNPPPPLSDFPTVSLLSSSLPAIQFLSRLSSSELISSSTQRNAKKTRIYLYREDLSSPLAFGGNKIRKLEYVIPRFLNSNTAEEGGKGKSATLLLTEGGVQSNHTRQTAAAAAALGLKCTVLLSPWTRSEDPNYEVLGNVQICRMLGADVKMLSKDEVEGASVRVKEELEGSGEVVAWIPAGSSLDERGGLGYARWVSEMLWQEEKMKGEDEGFLGFDCVVVTCVSGSTLGGMVAGLKLAEKIGLVQKGRLKLLGIDASAKDVMGQRELVLKIAKTTASLIGLSGSDVPNLDDVSIDGRWNAGRYGHCDDATKQAMKILARLEGVLTDPVYTGKGFNGLLQPIREGSISGNVLFVHTGGQTALSVYGGIERD